ncbi:hypothetical protein [Streptomyces sp. TP-A0356]|uniref:hypothetical protein n=1 Tax=Streptomyces sp. TP-A0356 TaxID=1359208 RepID=UPI0006E29353|nr:hypothetical protein [Streptomyces sp. TP-A0356]
MLFRRRTPPPLLPADIVRRMEIYGRWEFDPPSSDADIPALVYTPLYPIASVSPDAFVEALADAVLPVGGWAVYGGSHCVRDLLTASYEHPRHDDMLDGAVDFLRAERIAPARLNSHEWQRWCTTHPGEEW